MNKKETLEIRKQFTPANCTISSICGCYVDHEKNKKMEARNAFLSLSEEESFKYFDIFKKTLSGSMGKNMLNLEFPLEQEAEGGTQNFFMKLRKSKLQDDDLLEEFYDRIIENYDFGENYYIILIHAMYDVPGKASDDIEMFDASDSVYEYLMCSICPVALSKGGLYYNVSTNAIEERVRDWLVGEPDKGILFPAFTDRNADIHGALYYTKKAEDLQSELIENVLGAVQPMTAKTQKETFQSILTETLGDESDYEIVCNIHENIAELMEEHKEEPEPLQLSRTDVKKVLEKSGVPQENMEDFDLLYDAAAGEQASLLASNIVDTKKVSIETPDVVVKVEAERAQLLETRMIDGRQYLLIPVDDYMEVNGITVRAVGKDGTAEFVATKEEL
ncbi:MAG: DUF4317 domain-containing protein [Lachnospiraceae bacterium]|nr:DUF4317 domain-containing protein [Lachnospiraceae bacterium]